MALSQAVIDAFNKGGTGGRRAALPDGTKVRAVIQPSKKDIGYIEREPFSSKPESPNSRLQALRMRFVVPEGFPHANANFFASIPVKFEMWSDKANALSPSYQSIGLVKALGYALEDLDEDTIEKLTDRELLNKTVELVLGVEDDKKFDATNPEELAKAAKDPLYAKRNSVKFINQASSASAPTATAGPAAALGGARAAAPAPANDPWAHPAAPIAPPVTAQVVQAAAPANTAAPVAQTPDPWAAAAAPGADPWAAAALAGVQTPH